MVAPKNNEWGSDYWLERCLEGKQTLLEPVTDDEILNSQPVNGYKRGVIDTCITIEKEGWVCISGL